MADRTFFDMQSYSRGLIHLVGAFAPNGASAVNNALNKGHGFTVARTGVGAFDITIEDSFVDFVAIMAQISAAAISNEYVRPGTIGVPASNVIELLAWQDDGDTTVSAVDIAADADTFIHFLAVLKNTSVTR